jgi:saccharopepsin
MQTQYVESSPSSPHTINHFLLKSTISLITDIGIYGLMGLGFDDPLVSPINDKIKSLYGSEQPWAASVLANIFQQNTSQPDIVALQLQRTGDLEDTDGGTFSIGEVEQEFASVLNSPNLAQYPPGNGRWTTLMDGMRVDGKSVSIKSSMKGVPSGKVVTLLDTGNPSLQLTQSMQDAIFSGIKGAVVDPSSGTWIVPCNITTIVEFEFRYVDNDSSPFLIYLIGYSGQWYAVHPLDLTTVDTFQDNSGQNLTVCSGSNVVVAPGDGFDISLGTPYLRNVYSVYVTSSSLIVL